MFKQALLIWALIAALTTSPQRTVEQNQIVSRDDPRALISLPADIAYVGADRWILNGIADCEIHVFVTADSRRQIGRLCWVQFEHYLPSKPELHHDYHSNRHVQINGLVFDVDTWTRGNDEEVKAGSDRDHVQALTKSVGLNLPSSMMYVRLVHLLDDQKRHELMFIYAEDLAKTGLTARDLAPTGAARDRWPALADGLIDRATKSVQINTQAGSRDWGAGSKR